VGSAALSCFFALTSYSLRIARRSQLEETFAGPEGKKRLELLDRHLRALRLTTSLLRLASNLILMVGMLFLFRREPLEWGPWALAGSILTSAAIIAIFGIAIPQAWASYAAERVLAATLGVLLLCRYMLYPVVAVMEALDLPVRRLTGAVEAEDENGETAKAEILQAATNGQAEGAVDADEVEMIESVMEFGDTHAGEIMTPRTDLFALPVDMPWQQACRKIVEAGHTRVPVYEGDLDHIIGVLYAKDLLQLVAQSKQVPLRQIMRKPYFVPETKPLDDLLREFKRRKVHIAVVLDEYGGTAGIATIEDLLEEIVGEIADEYEREERPEIELLEDGRLRVDVTVQPEGEVFPLDADLVVLSAGIEPNVDNEKLAQLFKVPLNEDGFFLEAHVKLRPLDFAADGVYLCGMAHSPRFLEETVAQARGAAVRAVSLLSRDKLEATPIVASVNPRLCSACGLCVEVCPYDARVLEPGAPYAEVIEVLCQGCGACITACPNKASQQKGFEVSQLYGMLDAIITG